RFQDEAVLRNNNLNPLDLWDDDIALELRTGNMYYEEETLIIGDREAVVSLNPGASLRLTRDAFTVLTGGAAVNSEQTFAWPAALEVRNETSLSVAGTLRRNGETTIDGRLEIHRDGRLEIDPISDLSGGGVIQVAGACVLDGGPLAVAPAINLAAGSDVYFIGKQLTGPQENGAFFDLGGNAVLSLTGAGDCELSGQAAIINQFAADFDLHLNNAVLRITDIFDDPVKLRGVTAEAETGAVIELGAEVTLIITDQVASDVEIIGKTDSRLEFESGGEWNGAGINLIWNDEDNDWEPAI
ncbi:MAG: hypothetical protein LBH21_08790, partial [Gracilibacteraceae bacterium]|nr:hypothetical protein [Gracilibacteraceae bacterium]